MSLSFFVYFEYSVPCRSGDLAHARNQLQSLARKGMSFYSTAYKTGFHEQPQATDRWVFEISPNEFWRIINPAVVKRIARNVCRMLVSRLSVKDCGQVLLQPENAKNNLTNICLKNEESTFSDHLNNDAARDFIENVFAEIPLSDLVKQVVKHQAFLVNLILSKKTDVVNEANLTFNWYPGSWLGKESARVSLFSPWMDTVFAEPVLQRRESTFNDKGKTITVSYWEDTEQDSTRNTGLDREYYLPLRCGVHKILASGTTITKIESAHESPSEVEFYAILLFACYHSYQFNAPYIGYNKNEFFHYNPNGLTKTVSSSPSSWAVLLYGEKHKDLSAARPAVPIVVYNSLNMSPMQIMAKARVEFLKHIGHARELLALPRHGSSNRRTDKNLVYYQKILELCDGMF